MRLKLLSSRYGAASTTCSWRVCVCGTRCLLISSLIDWRDPFPRLGVLHSRVYDDCLLREHAVLLADLASFVRHPWFALTQHLSQNKNDVSVRAARGCRG